MALILEAPKDSEMVLVGDDSFVPALLVGWVDIG